MAKFHYRESPTPKQKKSFAKYLSEGEELILVTGLSQAYIRSKVMFYLFFPGLLFFGFGWGLGWILGFSMTWTLTLASLNMLGVVILKTMHLYHSIRYLLTTRRVIIKHGLFSVKLTAALYDKVTNLEVDQSFLDRILLHHGTIVVNTSGLNRNEMVLCFIDYPMEFKNLLERLIIREREQMGLSSFSGATVEGEIVS